MGIMSSSRSWALSVTITLLLSLHVSSYQNQATGCTNLQGVGDHVVLNAECYSDGTVRYDWDVISGQQFLGDLKICYTCSTPEGNTSDIMTVASSDLERERMFSLSAEGYCVFGGCYVYSKTSDNFPTLAIPQATCTEPINSFSSSFHVSSVATSSSPHEPVVPTTSASPNEPVNVIPTTSSSPSEPVAMGATSSLHKLVVAVTRATTHSSSVAPTMNNTPDQPTDIIYRLEIPAVAIFSAIIVFIVLAISAVGLWLCLRKSKQLQRYRFKNKINKQISQIGYDDTASDPVTPDTPTFQYAPTPSLYSLLDPYQTMVVESEGTVSGYVTEEGLPLGNWDYPAGISQTMSPTLSDQSGYIFSY